MTDILLTILALATFGLWSLAMIAAGIYGQRLRTRSEQRRRITRLVRQVHETQQAAARQHLTPSDEVRRRAQA